MSLRSKRSVSKNCEAQHGVRETMNVSALYVVHRAHQALHEQVTFTCVRKELLFQ
jgi:hypothetical protein